MSRPNTFSLLSMAALENREVAEPFLACPVFWEMRWRYVFLGQQSILLVPTA